MSRSFIGSKIAIVTKSQCRHVGTIIGIDAEASSIILGNVKCFGTENRADNGSNGQLPDTIVPIMQFANSDIEDLKIVEEEQTEASGKAHQQIAGHSLAALSSSSPGKSQKQSSIHDDPAIVSAVVSTSKNESGMSHRLMQDLRHLNLSDEPSKNGRKNEGSELGALWSMPSKWGSHTSSSQQQQPAPHQSGSRSKFFDDFTFNKPEQSQSNRAQHGWPSNSHSTQTSHHHEHEDEKALPVRQPFFSDDGSNSPIQSRQQNGQQQRYFYNNRPPQQQQQQQQNYSQQRRPAGGNRETFYESGNAFHNDFDFETSNRKFNKLSTDEEFKQPADMSSQLNSLTVDSTLSADHKPLYDKKKSFFDNMTPQETSDVHAPMYNRSRNHDTFGSNGHDRYQRQNNRGGNGFRRTNYRQQQQQGNDDFYPRSQNNNNNGYRYRY